MGGMKNTSACSSEKVITPNDCMGYVKVIAFFPRVLTPTMKFIVGDLFRQFCLLPNLPGCLEQSQ